jgi:hypothetical protein
MAHSFRITTREILRHGGSELKLKGCEFQTAALREIISARLQIRSQMG